ncbi:MAG TPA: TIGR03435 family protein [Candidatus Sulfopaludibacter sp.]|jgi:uncharacterized protein (TIGR03435 family)|nr:TIGR03435 family protein [Candidatus Sulfopaludibacter sp.]
MWLRRVCIFLWTGLLLAQTPAFEVASIKLSTPRSERGSKGGPRSSDPGRYSFHAANLDDLIAIAFNVDYRQISSKVKLDQDAFDFDAKLPPDTNREQLRLMLQNFLAERFHLKHHMETRDFAGYELVVAKSGPRLLAGGSSPEHLENFPDLSATRPGMTSVHTLSNGSLLVRMRGRLQTMKSLADSLQPPDDGPVVDKTGLDGKYDFSLEYATERPNASADTASPPSVIPDLFAAIQQQLGLQLIRKKLAFDVVVVDSVDKLPTEN